MSNLNNGYLYITIAICTCFSYGYTLYDSPVRDLPSIEVDIAWVDTTLATMTLAEKIGQLFIIRSDIQSNNSSLENTLTATRPSGVILQNGSLHSYITAINKLRRISHIPLFEISDQCISFHNQISDLPNFPSSATLSAIHDEPFKNILFERMLDDFSTVGIRVSFAPNIHLPTSAINSYSPLNNEMDEALVMQRASRQVSMLKNKHVLPILQGFKLPINIDESSSKSATVDYFKVLQANGLAGVYFDKQSFEEKNIPRPPNFLKSYLQEDLQFDGLVIGEIDGQKATFIDFYYAGADLFIVSDTQITQIIQQAKYLIEHEIIDIAKIDKKVRSILLAKAQLGLNKGQLEPIERRRATAKIASTRQTQLRDIYREAAIIIPDKEEALPLATTYGSARHIVHISHEKMGTLQRTAFEYVNSKAHLHPPNKNGIISPLSFQSDGDLYIIALNHIDLYLEENRDFIASIQRLSKQNKVVLINFGNPFNLGLFSDDIAMVQLFDNNNYTQRIAIELLFGSLTARGKLPINISPELPFGYIYGKQSISRLARSTPEQVGISSQRLLEIEAIIHDAIEQKAMPGCQVLIAKSGNIIYSRGFGYHTYQKRQRVERSDIYDVASVTKIAATTLAMMKLYEEGAVSIEESLGNQMSLPYTSTISNISPAELLTHRSGLQKNMPIAPYLSSRNKRNCKDYFCTSKTKKHSQKISDQFYFDPSYQSQIWEDVNRLIVNNGYKRYVYGDVNFYILQQFIESKTQKGLDDYVHKNFYKSLGLRYSLFNPLKRLPKSMITPTEDDQRWRKALIRGHVHDESAALLGGVGGNAGLFSNAEDLAILFQMLLNGGTYGGKRYLEAATIEHFTSNKYSDNRGLGFDKHTNNQRRRSIVPSKTSPNTYGHNGFTGTCVWVDPEHELIYIFLSNRIYPNVKNYKLSRLGIRKKIHEIIYDAMDETIAEETLYVQSE